MAKSTIIVDSREQRPLFNEEDGAIVRKLDTGDYTAEGAENILAIERKSKVSEFANNITESRFWDWVNRLAEFEHAYLLLEFNEKDVDNYPAGSGIPKYRWKYLRVKSPFIKSTLAKLEELGIKIIYTSNRTKTKKKILQIIRCIHQ